MENFIFCAVKMEVRATRFPYMFFTSDADAFFSDGIGSAINLLMFTAGLKGATKL